MTELSEVPQAVLEALRRADRPDAGPQTGELWRSRDADGHTATMVWVRAVSGDDVEVTPVTFDTELADDHTLVVDAERSPLGIELAVHLGLETTIGVATLIDRLGSFDDGDGGPGPAVVSPLDERAEFAAALASPFGADGDESWWPLPSPPSALADLLLTIHGELSETHPAARVVPRPDGAALVAEMDAFVLVATGAPSLDAARRLLHADHLLNAVCLVEPEAPYLAVVLDRRDVVDAIETPSGVLRPARTSRPPMPVGEALVKFLDHAISPFGRLAGTVVDAQGLDARELAVDVASEAVRAVEASARGFKVEGKRPGYERVTRHKLSIIALVEAALAEPEVDVESFLEERE